MCSKFGVSALKLINAVIAVLFSLKSTVWLKTINILIAHVLVSSAISCILRQN